MVPPGLLLRFRHGLYAREDGPRRAWLDWPSVSASSVVWLGASLVGLEVVSKSFEYLAASWFERRAPVERQEAWAERSLGMYKEIAAKVVEDALPVHTRYYPEARGHPRVRRDI